MVAEAKTWVDIENAIREWTRDSIPTVARRVFFSANTSVTEPQIVIQRIAGPDDACRIQFDVWSRTKADAARIQGLLCTAIDALASYVFDGILLHGAVVESVIWQPDPANNYPRYIIDATFVATPSS